MSFVMLGVRTLCNSGQVFCPLFRFEIATFKGVTGMRCCCLSLLGVVNLTWNSPNT